MPPHAVASAASWHSPPPSLSWVGHDPTPEHPAIERALARVIRFAYGERADEALADPVLCEQFRDLIRRQLADPSRVLPRPRRSQRAS